MTSTLRKRDKSETYFREVSKARSLLPTLDDGVPSAFLECAYALLRKYAKLDKDTLTQLGQYGNLADDLEWGLLTEITEPSYAECFSFDREAEIVDTLKYAAHFEVSPEALTGFIETHGGIRGCAKRYNKLSDPEV